jgi:hypothetical protein
MVAWADLNQESRFQTIDQWQWGFNQQCFYQQNLTSYDEDKISKEIGIWSNTIYII